MYRQAQPQKHKPRLAFLVALAVVGLGIGWFIVGKQSNQPSNSASTAGQNSQPSFNKQLFSTSDPASPWIVVNKQRPLNPKTYAPADLVVPDISLKGSKTSEAMKVRAEAATALETMDKDAKAAGVKLVLVSAYRSHNTQDTIYKSEVRGFGQAQADRESARPGHSEHQTGWAVDLGAADGACEIKTCFADTPEGKWLAANAHTYGFIIRYTATKEKTTGYMYEPWHLRYVGVTLAAEMHRTGIETLEEFFDLPAAASY